MDERTPLLPVPGGSISSNLGDHHSQFCHLVGARPVNQPREDKHRPHSRSLYARAVKRKNAQHFHYVFTAALFNTLLLAQVVLGAALTGLGASNSSRILITVFGALNTIIAGAIAFLKSRGQPMRARMFRDDLSRVVDEIESSAVMWYGISVAAHGYDAIDIDEQVTVRSEVARLTRLYDKAVKTNTMNDPDMYSGGASSDLYNASLRKHPDGVIAGQAPGVPNPAAANVPQEAGGSTSSQPPPPAPTTGDSDPDASPASKVMPEQQKPKKEDEPPTPKEIPGPAKSSSSSVSDSTDAASETPIAEEPAAEGATKGKGKGVSTVANPSTPSLPRTTSTKSATANVSSDPDESPASAAYLPKKEDSLQSNKTLVNDNSES